jgi:hypothetical protein
MAYVEAAAVLIQIVALLIFSKRRSIVTTVIEPPRCHYWILNP